MDRIASIFGNRYSRMFNNKMFMKSNRQMLNLNPLKILLHIPVPWVYVLTYLIGLLFQFLVPFNLLSGETLTYVRIFGVVLFATGAIFASWSLIIFHKARTTTTPGESSEKIVMHGPYRLTRNPMYVSLFLAYLGEAGILAQLWPVIVFPLIFAYVNWVVIPLEEEVLKNDFEDNYVNYCSQVRRWF